MSSALSTALLWAAALTLLIELIRALPLSGTWRTSRPWNCDVCMASWFVIGVCTLEFFTRANPGTFVLIAASGGFALLFLALRRKLTDKWEPPT